MRWVIWSGAVLGLVAGLEATVFESPLSVDADVQVRLGYPLALGVFNVAFWTAFGSASALVLMLVTRLNPSERPVGRERQWTWVFLLPFAIVYSLGGRIRSMFSDTESIPAFAFDHLLPTLGAVSIVALVWVNQRRAGDDGRPRLGFAFETFSIILFVQVHAHLRELIPVAGFPVDGRTLLVAAALAALLSTVFAFVAAPRLDLRITAVWGARSARLIVVGVLGLAWVSAVTGATGLADYRNKVVVGALSTALRSNPSVGAAQPPVILIVLDTVRADHLSVYGSIGRTPNLEEFAKTALVFDDARSASSWTLPSHASIFTGLFPREHGSHNAMGGVLDGQGENNALSEELTTIAEIFHDNGYLTAGAIANFAFVGRLHDFEQGFDLYDDRKGTGYDFRMGLYGSVFQSYCYVTGYCSDFIKPSRQADAISGIALDALAFAGDAPMFVFLNYYDAHMWYRPPSPFDGYFLEGVRFPKLHRMWISFRRMVTGTLSDEEYMAYLRTQYDGEVSFLDSQLGRLFDELKRTGVYDRALIVVTSDHGELFGEHGFRFHGTPLYEGVVKVPLLIKFPHAARVGRDASPITSVDLLPTILSVVGLPIPTDVSGRAFGGDPISVTELYDADLKHRVGEHHALVRWPYKYMFFAADRPPELYDLAHDPMESANLFESEPQIAASLEADLQAWLAAHAPRGLHHRVSGTADDAKMHEQLEALGYVQ